MTTALEARVWLGSKGRFNPLQQFSEGSLRLDGDVLTFRGDQGETLATTLSEAQVGFPLSMTGAGFVLTVRGKTSYVWFYDPFAGRGTLLSGGGLNKARLEGAKGWFKGRKAAKPWLKALRASASGVNRHRHRP
jgi:hypothetical protein